MTEDDNKNIEPEQEQGGVEYAVMRVSDGMFLSDDDLNGVHQAWEDDEENASWVDTEEDALRLADLAGLTDDGRLSKGYRITERPWYYEDDLEEDDE